MRAGKQDLDKLNVSFKYTYIYYVGSQNLFNKATPCIQTLHMGR